MTTSQHARYMRAEIEAIAASLRVHQLARLLELGRSLLEVQDTSEEEWHNGGAADQNDQSSPSSMPRVFTQATP